MPLTPSEQQALMRRISQRRSVPTTPSVQPDAEAEPVSAPPVVQQEEQGGGGFGDLFPGFIADPFKKIVPRGVRDVAGAAVQNVVSGERFVNTVGGFVGQGDLGTRIAEKAGDVPVAGRVLRPAFDILASPLSLATIGAGPALSGGLKGLGLAGRAAAGVIEPLVAGGPAARAAAELGLGLGFEFGTEAAIKAGVPPEIALLAGFGAGGMIAGTIGGITGRRQAKALRQSPENVTALLALRGTDTVKYAEGLLRTAVRTTTTRTAKQARSVELAVRGRAGGRELFMGNHTVESFNRARGAAEGELPRGAEFDFTRGGADPLTLAEFNELSAKIGHHKLYEAADGTVRDDAFYEMLQAQAGMMRALDMTELPQRSQMILLERVFGSDFVEPLKELRGLGRKVREDAMNFVNIPRSLMSSADLSAWLRQGALFVTRKEAYTNLWPMLRSFVSEGYAARMEKLSTEGFDAIAGSREAAARRAKAGQVHTWLDGDMFGREEAFISGFADVVPLVRRSQRAFTTYLNKLRDDFFDDTVARWDRAGVTTVADEKSLATWAATSTGRGIQEPNAWSKVASNLFFSPQKFIANMKVISTQAFWSATPLVRREVARDMVGFVAVGISALAMMNLAGKSMGFPVSIETNPLSSDFGKGKVGKVRYDPWAGFQPIARYIAQFLTGKRQTLGGDLRDQDRGITVARFAQSKLAPVPGAITDLIRGQDFLGDEVSITNLEQMSELAAERLTPMFAQDLLEAAREEGGRGLIKALPGAFGVGVGSYTTLAEERDRLALQKTDGEFQWGDLSNLQKQEIEQENEEVLKRAAGEPDKDSFVVFRTLVDEDTREKESGLMADLAGGADPRAVNESLVRLWRERSVRLSTAAEREGFQTSGEDEVDAFFRALGEAESSFGIIDFALRDQLSEQLMEELEPQVRKRVEERQTFIHDPSVSEFVTARDFIRESTYWSVQQDAFATNEQRVERVAPGVTTYFQLQRAQRLASRRSAVRIDTVLADIDRRTTLLRERLRRRSSELDAALVTVYGLTPIFSRR